jgi:hypothetical protein
VHERKVGDCDAFGRLLLPEESDFSVGAGGAFKVMPKGMEEWCKWARIDQVLPVVSVFAKQSFEWTNHNHHIPSSS